MGWRDGDFGHSYDYRNNRWICNGLGWEEKEMSLYSQATRWFEAVIRVLYKVLTKGNFIGSVLRLSGKRLRT